MQLKEIQKIKGQIEKILSDNKTYKFDKLVLATHADQALSLIEKPTVEEKNLLSIFKSERKLFIIGPPPCTIIGFTPQCFIKTISLAKLSKSVLLVIA